MNTMKVKVLVCTVDNEGNPGFFRTAIEVTGEEFHQGIHHDKAMDQVENLDLSAVLAYDEFELSNGKTLQELADWVANDEEGTFSNYLDAMTAGCEAAGLSDEQPGLFIRGYVDANLAKMADEDFVEDLLADFAQAHNIVVQKLENGKFRFLLDN